MLRACFSVVLALGLFTAVLSLRLVLTMLGVARLVAGGDQPSRMTATIEMHPVPLPGGGLLATRITF